MRAPRFDPHTFLPLAPATFHILLALVDGERHGYAITMKVAAATDGRMKLGPGTLYGALKRLLASKLIEESEERPDPAFDDERRRYYRLTARGRAVVQAEVQRLAALVKIARASGLKPAPFASPA
jgi:DNA-binding PadR family transcriptional regulator